MDFASVSSSFHVKFEMFLEVVYRMFGNGRMPQHAWHPATFPPPFPWVYKSSPTDLCSHFTVFFLLLLGLQLSSPFGSSVGNNNLSRLWKKVERVALTKPACYSAKSAACAGP
jgi:hypothetical protein